MKTRISILFIILALAALACSFRPPAPTPVPTRVPPSTQDTVDLQREVATASANLAKNGKLKITFTEQQLTAVILNGLANQPDIVLTEAQVTLQEGQIQLNGKTVLGTLSVPAVLVLKPYAEGGMLKVEVVSATFGDIPVPAKSLAQITSLINSNLNQSIVIEGKQIQVEQIQIGGGKMTISGTGR